MHQKMCVRFNQHLDVMTKSRSQELAEKADRERRRCRDWLLAGRIYRAGLVHANVSLERIKGGISIEKK
jgi:hypothetical protein